MWLKIKLLSFKILINQKQDLLPSYQLKQQLKVHNGHTCRHLSRYKETIVHLAI